MQPTIHVLSDEAINQIAAGEVIESPASVVKELVENALDAGSTKIVIEITGGGLRLIRVSDNGMGMHRLDAKQCIVRHATSKIRGAADLFKIASKGFRGEALASIASISKLTLTTALDGETGTRLFVEKGEVVKETASARTRGTTIEVDSLFYNVPARKKFQKTSPAIAAEIYRVVTLMALSHPEVHFELISNGRSVIKTMATGMKERGEELLGSEFLSGSFSLDFEHGALKFKGFIGSPTDTRTNKMGEYLFLNKRAVSCSAIYEAVRAGYGTRLDSKRHPIFLLYLDVPPDLVDVNVHPQKLQVRLRKEELFREVMQEAVEKALAPKKEHREVQAYEFTYVEPKFEEVVFKLQEEEVESLELPLEEEEAVFMGRQGRFLIFREGDELLLVDSNAARFRFLFEELLSKMENGGESQGLLVPFTIELTPVEGAMLLTHMEAVEELGFKLRPIGKEVFMVEALPPFVQEGEVKRLVAEVALSLQEFIGKMDYAEKRREKLALIAASRAKETGVQSDEQALHFLKRLKGCTSPFHDPKGEPTMVVVDNDTIENLFNTHSQPAKADR